MMHVYRLFLFGLLHCETCGRLVKPTGDNPNKWVEIIPGDRTAGHTFFIADDPVTKGSH